MIARRRARRILRRVVPAIPLLLGLALAPSVRAAGPAITGKVVNGTTNEAVANLDVVLHAFTDQTPVSESTATSAADGTFSFQAPAAGVTTIQLTAAYRGTAYWSKVVKLQSGKAPHITLDVYEPTTDSASITLTNWVVWVDREGSAAAVQQDLEWSNSGKTAYVGTVETGNGSRIVTQVPVAPGASNLQFLGLFLQSPGQVGQSSYIGTQPLIPGRSQATLRYTVDSLQRLSLPVTLATSNFQLFVASGIEVTTDGLTAAGQYEDKGTTYQVFTASNLSTGDNIEVSLSGLTGGGLSPYLFVVIGAGVVVVIGLIVVWRLGRARTGRPATRQAPRTRDVSGASRAKGRGRVAPARSKAAVRPRPAAHPKPVALGTDGSAVETFDEYEEEGTDLLIDEIAALDLSFERGLLDRRTYESLRTAAKKRLLRARAARAGDGPGR